MEAAVNTCTQAARVMKERKEIEDTHLRAARSVPEKRGEKLFTVKNSLM